MRSPGSRDVVALTYDGLCTFEFGIVVEVFGLAALRGREWVDGLPQGHNMIKVAVAEVPVVHQVKAIEFAKWLERSGGSPRDVVQRDRIRAILGMPTRR